MPSAPVRVGIRRLLAIVIVVAVLGGISGSSRAVSRYVHTLGAGMQAGHFCPPGGTTCDIKVYWSVSDADKYDKWKGPLKVVLRGVDCSPRLSGGICSPF